MTTRGVQDVKFVIGSITGDVMKVCIRQCSMEDVKGAVSAWSKNELAYSRLVIAHDTEMERGCGSVLVFR